MGDHVVARFRSSTDCHWRDVELLVSVFCLFARSTPERKQEIAIAVHYPHDPNGVVVDFIQHPIASHQNLTQVGVIKLEDDVAAFRKLGQRARRFKSLPEEDGSTARILFLDVLDC